MPAQRLAVVEAHLARTKAIYEQAIRLVALPTTHPGLGPEADYHLAHAELLVAEAKGLAKENPTLIGARTRRRDAARRAYKVWWSDAQEDHDSGGDPSLHKGLEWSRLILDAELALQATNASRQKAAKDYLDRFRNLDNLAGRAARTSTPLNSAEVLYYSADAEYVVRQLATTARNQPTLPQLSNSRLQAVKSVYEAMWNEYLTGPGSFEWLYHWSMLWRSTALEISKRESDQVAAAKDHLKRMTDLRALVDHKLHGELRDAVYATEYYQAQAEILLSQALTARAGTELPANKKDRTQEPKP
jgi:hypothetical protein